MRTLGRIRPIVNCSVITFIDSTIPEVKQGRLNCFHCDMFSRCLTVRHPWCVRRSAAYPFCTSRHFSKLTPLEQSLLFKFCCSNCGLFSVVLVLFHLRSICRFVHSAWAKILFFVFCVSISRPIVALDPLTQINWHPSFPPHWVIPPSLRPYQPYLRILEPSHQMPSTHRL